jgi:hypothetical protein
MCCNKLNLDTEIYGDFYCGYAEKTTLRTEKTTITDGDLISRQKEVKK